MELPAEQILKIRGCCKHDAWGGTSYLPELLSLEPQNCTYSEYWLGVYPDHSACLAGSNESLFQYIQHHPLWSQRVSLRPFPFLLKVLDINDMLSLQVHPPSHKAELGFGADQALYKDPYAKHEALYALTDVHLFHGLLAPEALLARLRAIPVFAPYLAIFAEKGYSNLLARFLALSEDETIRFNATLISFAKEVCSCKREDLLDPNYWLLKYISTCGNFNPADKAMALMYCLNLLRLPKEQVLYTPPGVIHSYLSGVGLEVMSSSDNVLRFGLSKKRVNPTAALDNAHLLPSTPTPTVPAMPYENVYSYAFEDCCLGFSVVKSTPPFTLPSVQAKNIAIVLALGSPMSVINCGKTVVLSRGEAAVIFPGAFYQLDLASSALAVVASGDAPY